MKKSEMRIYNILLLISGLLLGIGCGFLIDDILPGRSRIFTGLTIVVSQIIVLINISVFRKKYRSLYRELE